jgi:hypothetical protein
MAAVDPYAALFGAVAGVATPGGAGPSDAKSSGSAGVSLDNSGWNVTFGNNSAIDATRSQTAPTVSATGGALGTAGAALAGLGINSTHIAMAVGALVLVKVLKKRRAS